MEKHSKQSNNHGKLEQVVQECLECNKCSKFCPMLIEAGSSPKKIANKFLDNSLPQEIPYSCTLCGQCTVKCPKKLDLAGAFLEMRRHKVRCGQGPLKSYRPVRFHQYFGFHPLFNASLSPQQDGSAKTVFMAGCALPSYSPVLVERAMVYLQEAVPGSGAVLKCCGKPTQQLGLEDLFLQRFASLEQEFDKLDAQEVVTACQSCYVALKAYGKRPVRSFYELLAEKGIPPEVRGAGQGRIVTVHDSCSIREYSGIHDAVREVLKQAGYQVAEMKHNRAEALCCGFGGMVAVGNPKLARKYMQQIISGTKGLGADLIITYCAACREAMMMAGKPSLHLLDLIFRPEEVRGSVPGLPKNSIENWVKRWQSKQSLIKVLK